MPKKGPTPRKKTTRLFHLTADLPSHWGSIEKVGAILPLARIPERPGAAKAAELHPEDARLDELVWLTSAPRRQQGWTDGLPKQDVCIEVDPGKIKTHRWSEYAPKRFSKDYRRALNDPSFGDHRDWYVVEGSVPRDAWLEVTFPGRESS